MIAVSNLMTNINNIRIRPITYDDTDLIVKWRNLDAVRNNFFYREEFTAATHLNWMDSKVKSGEVVQYIIEADGRPVGSTYLRDIDREKLSAEYGVFIGEDVRGRGIGTEALKLTLAKAQSELGLKHIIARAIEGNEASINCFLHAGFIIDDTIPDVECSDGVRVNMVMMSKEL